MPNVFSRGNKLHNYTILVLGPTASGKTVFLASMYHELSVSDTGFFLRADDPEQQEELINLYSQIIDTNQDFPNAIDVWTKENKRHPNLAEECLIE